MTSCSCTQIREAGGFSSFPDYEVHKEAVLNSGLFDTEPVTQRYGGVGGLEESWSRCKACGELWRLVEPDPPFKGMWSPVSDV